MKHTILLLLSLLAACHPAHAQATILSANPTVIRVNFSIVIGYIGPMHAASMQFTVTGPNINFLVPSPGSSAVAAGKSVQCNPLVVSPGPPQTSTMTCVVFGINQDTMAPGTVTNFYAIAVPDTKPADMRLVLSDVLASDPNGNQIQMVITTPAQAVIGIPCISPTQGILLFTKLPDGSCLPVQAYAAPGFIPAANTFQTAGPDRVTEILVYQPYPTEQTLINRLMSH